MAPSALVIFPLHSSIRAMKKEADRRFEAQQQTSGTTDTWTRMPCQRPGKPRHAAPGPLHGT